MNRKTGKKGSRVTQRKKHEAKVAKGMTVDDFDLTLDKHANGREVDPVEGRETRLPIVLKGMRDNLSIREIAYSLNVHPATVATDKRFILEEAWELRQDLMSLWLEEQLQQYERLLQLLSKELLYTREEETEERVNLVIMDKMMAVMDKVNEMKGLKQAPTFLGINAGDNATFNLNQDASAAHELVDYIKSGKVGSDAKALIS